VRRERQQSNSARLAKAKGDPRTLWQIANAAVGKNGQSLPSSLDDVARNVETKTDLEAATLMNHFYIDKVAKLKQSVNSAPPPAAVLMARGDHRVWVDVHHSRQDLQARLRAGIDRGAWT
jgi:hypothetical protein